MALTYPWSERRLRSIHRKEEEIRGREKPASLWRKGPEQFEIKHRGHAALSEPQHPISQGFSRRTREGQSISNVSREVNVPVNRGINRGMTRKTFNLFISMVRM